MEGLDPKSVAAIYAEPPEQFVAARARLVARLKEAGDAEASRAAAALRKPSVAAWAIDALARERPEDIRALIEAGARLASAQRELASGGSAGGLHEAGSERRRLADRLVRAAARILEGAGMSSARATLDKISNTLMAIATDDEAADRVSRGVLDKELPAPAGFGEGDIDTALLASVTELRSPSSDPGSGGTPAQQRRDQRAREQAERLAAEALELENEADRLEHEARRLDRARTEAETSAAVGARAAASARRRADAARRRADAAAR